MKDYTQVVVKPGGSVDLPCQVRSNLAQVLWKFNGDVLSEASHFLLMGENGLLIYSVTPEDQGRYECWSIESGAGKNFTRLVAGYVLRLDLPDSVPSISSQRPLSDVEVAARSVGSTVRDPTALTEGNNGNTSGPPRLTSGHTEAPPLTTSSNDLIKPKHYHPPGVSNLPTRTETADPSAKYIQRDNSGALLALFLLFFLLFLAALVYNCYMQYLPAPCLRLRAALLGSQKKPQPEYVACEAGLIEKTDLGDQPVQNGAHPMRALRDTGYETEPECENGGVLLSCKDTDNSASKERPFDVDCISQPIEYADADAPN